MKRQIITIDQEKCNGCGQCVSGCPEGALQMINGKAHLVNDLFCDGLGACISECPVGAITIEERDAEAYNERLVMDRIIQGGEPVIKAHLKHLYEHMQHDFLQTAIEVLKEKNLAIPDYMSQEMPCQCHGHGPKEKSQPMSTFDNSRISEIGNWPLQLHLINPYAGWLKNADLLIAADCTAFAHPNINQKFMKDKATIIFCPKLDHAMEQYVEKLALIFREQDIKSITILRMEVPCCGGTEMIVQKALEMAQKNIFVKVYVISTHGEII